MNVGEIGDVDAEQPGPHAIGLDVVLRALDEVEQAQREVCGVPTGGHRDTFPLSAVDRPTPYDELDAFRGESAQRGAHFLIAALRNRHVAGEHGDRVRLRRLCAAPGCEQQARAFAQKRRADTDGNKPDERGRAGEHGRLEDRRLIDPSAVSDRVGPLDGVFHETASEQGRSAGRVLR